MLLLLLCYCVAKVGCTYLAVYLWLLFNFILLLFVWCLGCLLVSGGCFIACLYFGFAGDLFVVDDCFVCLVGLLIILRWVLGCVLLWFAYLFCLGLVCLYLVSVSFVWILVGLVCLLTMLFDCCLLFDLCCFSLVVGCGAFVRWGGFVRLFAGLLNSVACNQAIIVWFAFVLIFRLMVIDRWLLLRFTCFVLTCDYMCCWVLLVLVLVCFINWFVVGCLLNVWFGIKLLFLVVLVEIASF